MFHQRSTLRILVVLSALALAVGCSNNPSGKGATAGLASSMDTAAEEAAIQKLYADWRDAVERGDIPAYVGVLHPDVRLFPPGAAPIVGAAGYGDFLVPVFASATYRIEVEQRQQVQVLGDTAVAEYEYIINIDLKNPNSAITQPGALTAARSRARYFDVLRKRSDGRWGIWRHLWQDQPLELQ